MNCLSCEVCNKDTRFVCRLDGNFFTTGEYSRIINEFNIHGVSLNQKINSVKHHLDTDTIEILKALFSENEAPINFDYVTTLQIVEALDFIQSRLSTDNKINNSYHSRGDGQ